MISKELILEGTKFRKTVFVTVYQDEIEIRPLSEIEIAKVFKRVEDLGFSTTDPKLSDNYVLQIEACRYGIVDPALHEIIEIDDIDLETGKKCKKKVEVFETMLGNALAEIGRAIINISTVNSEELMDFFNRVKMGESSHGSTIADINQE